LSSFCLDHPAIRAEVLTRAEAAWNAAVNQTAVDAPSVERRLARLRDLYEFGDIERGDYVTKRAQLARLLTSTQPTRSLDRERCIELLTQFEQIWAGETATSKREWLRIAIARVVVRDGRLHEIVLREETSSLFLEQGGLHSGSDGTRTRDLRRDSRRRGVQFPQFRAVLRP